MSRTSRHACTKLPVPAAPPASARIAGAGLAAVTLAAARLVAACLVASALIASCAGKPLAKAGEVRLWSSPEEGSSLKALAYAAMPDLLLSATPRGQPWPQLLSSGTDAADLVLTDWNHDVFGAKEEALIADLSPYRSRLRNFPALWPGLREAFAANPSFFPASVYCWGLFYNPAPFGARELAFPTSWKAFLDSLPSLKARGILPIALGAASGWPALAWLGYADIRLNGADAYRKLQNGSRGFDDLGLQKAYALIAEWKDAGYIAAAGPAGTWTEALAAVETGRAAYVLLGCSAASRVSRPEILRWAPLPSAGAKAGEMVVSQGFVLSAKARAPEAALALVDAYIGAGSRGMAPDCYRLPAAASAATAVPATAATVATAAAVAMASTSKKNVKETDSLASLKLSQQALLGSGAPLLPQLDRLIPPQAAYDASRTMASFFAVDARKDAAWLAAELGKTGFSQRAKVTGK